MTRQGGFLGCKISCGASPKNVFDIYEENFEM